MTVSVCQFLEIVFQVRFKTEALVAALAATVCINIPLEFFSVIFKLTCSKSKVRFPGLLWKPDGPVVLNLLGQKKKRFVSGFKPKKIRLGRSEIIFFFFLKFFYIHIPLYSFLKRVFRSRI